MIEQNSQELTQELVEKVSALLNKIPEHIARDLMGRRALWKKRQKELFNEASSRFDEIRKTMMNPQIFVHRDLDDITADLAFLTAYYTHIVEFDGIAMARKTISERYLYDNLSFLYKGGLVTGKGPTDWKADAYQKGFASVLIPLDQEVKAATYDMSISGVLEKEQTSKSEAIKLMIETFKKRHDALKDQKHTSGGNRTQ